MPSSSSNPGKPNIGRTRVYDRRGKVMYLEQTHPVNRPRMDEHWASSRKFPIRSRWTLLERHKVSLEACCSRHRAMRVSLACIGTRDFTHGDDLSLSMAFKYRETTFKWARRSARPRIASDRLVSEKGRCDLWNVARSEDVKDEVGNLKSSTTHGPSPSTARRGNGDADLKRRPASAPRDRE